MIFRTRNNGRPQLVAGPGVAAAEVRHVALLGGDYPELRFHYAVADGESVVRGQTLFTHRRFPAICFTAPAAGRVRGIHLGRKRRLTALIIERSGDQSRLFEHPGGNSLDQDPAVVRGLLLDSGLWPALRRRPFDRIPAPDEVPLALYVMANEPRALAPDPLTVIQQAPAAFNEGLCILSTLAPRTVVCMDSAAPLSLPDAPGLTRAVVSGGYPAGLTGLLLHRLEPGITAEQPVWYVGYQDVLRIGRLWRQGELDTRQVIAVSGLDRQPPHLVETCLGADLSEMFSLPAAAAGRLRCGPAAQARAPGPLTGFLGRYEQQIHYGPTPVSTSAAAGGLARLAARLLGRGELATPWPGAMLPLERLETGWPLAVPQVALLRTLLIQDAETAAALGALALAEEDLACCGQQCPAGLDYGLALRRTLDELERSA